MADETDAPSSLSIPFTGQTVTDRVTYRVETLLVPFAAQEVGSTHNSTDPNVTYIPGCGCCDSPFSRCRTVPCTQCVNGYGAYKVILTFTYTPIFPPLPDGTPSHPIVGTAGFYHTGNGTIMFPSYLAPFELFPVMSADCAWEGTVRNSATFGFFPGFTEPPLIYAKLYYSSGWKIDLDYSLDPTGATYIPSGNLFTVCLSSAPACPLLSQEIDSTICAQPAGNPWQAIGFDNSLTSGSWTTFFDVAFKSKLVSCGVPLIQTACCTEKIPARMLMSGTYIQTTLGSDPFQPFVDWQSGTTWAGIFVGLPSGSVYYAEVTCTSGAFHLKVWLGTSSGGTLVVSDTTPATTTCYPIYLLYNLSGVAGINGGGSFSIEFTA